MADRHLLDGVVIWVGYVVNMTMYADIRFDGNDSPGRRLVGVSTSSITPFLAIPTSTVNREIFAD